MIYNDLSSKWCGGIEPPTQGFSVLCILFCQRILWILTSNSFFFWLLNINFIKIFC